MKTLELEIDYLDSCNLLNTPERRLLIAVIERAILDYSAQFDSSAENSHRRQAEAWLFEKPTALVRPWSFKWMCDQIEEGSEIEGLYQKIHKLIKNLPNEKIEFLQAA